jgi:AmmeMemoRadiSam system protein B
MEIPIDIRPSPIAGKWYPGEAARLAESVDSYINSAQIPPIIGKVIGIMTPHAGHLYSGPVAGFAFATLRGLSPELVVIVSPMHHPYYQPLLTSAHDAYGTPLGPVPLDKKALFELDSHLKEALGFGLAAVRKDPEHSLEIELPFLQRVFTNEFHLLPVMVRDQSAHTAEALGHAIAKTVADKHAILVASTDLSHFYSQTDANMLDAALLHEVETFNPRGVLLADEEGRGFACGKAALAAMLWAARDLGADHVQVLHHATSGDVTGDFEQVVGYGSAVVTRQAVP